MKKVVLVNFVFACLVLFSLRLNAAALPAPDMTGASPANNSAGINVMLSFDWADVATATVYRIEISENADCSSPIVSIRVYTSDYTVAAPGLKYGKKYYWRIRAANDTASSSFSVILNFTTKLLDTPANHAAGVSTAPTLSWNAFEGAANYRLQISTASNFDSAAIVYDNPSITILSGALSPVSQRLENDRQYFWRVGVETTPGVWTYPETRTFYTASAVMPIPIYPIDSTLVYTRSAVLAWYTIPFSSGVTFDLLYSTAPPVDNQLASPTVIPDINTIYYTLEGLQGGTTYYWQLYSRTSTGALASVSSIESFVTTPDPGAVIPVPCWPVDNNPVYTTAPLLTWYLTTYVPGLQYRVQYQELPSGSGINTPWTSGTSITLSDLVPGKTYRWWVKSSLDPIGDPAGSGWSAPDTFTVDAGIVPTAVIPNLFYPVNGEIVYTNTPALCWWLGADGTGLQYQVQYSTESGFPDDTLKTKTLGPVSVTSILIPEPLEAGRTYYWRVCSRLEGSGTWTDYSPAASFTVNTVSAGTNQPVILTPFNSEIVNSTSPTLTWYIIGPSAGLKYRVEVYYLTYSPDNLFTTVNNIDSMSCTISGLTPGATYAWRVFSYEAANPAHESAPSAVYSFTVSAGPSGTLVPLAGSPVGGVKISTDAPVLTWFIRAAASPLKYELQYSLNKDMSDAQSIFAVGSTNKALQGLKAGSTYYWRVRSVNAEGKSSGFSNVESFVAASITGVEKKDNALIPSKYEVRQNYPNPFNPSTVIEYDLPDDGKVTLEVFNLLGEKVATLADGVRSAGSYKIQWNAVNQNSGIYICRLQVFGAKESFSQIRKMMLVK